MKKWLKKKYQTWDEFFRSKATNHLEWEVAELENIFTLVTTGFLIGLPSPPISIALELLPDMESNLILMLQRIETAHGPLSQLFSSLDVG